MSEEPLQRRQGDISLYGGDGESMPQDMWTHRTADVGAVRNALDDALYGAVAHLERIVQRKMSLDKGLHPSCKRNYTSLGLAPVGSALPVNHQAVSLPVDVVTGEARKLPHTQAGVEERPHNKSLLVALAGLGQTGGFLLDKRLTLILIRHVVYCRVCVMETRRR